ncbi:hypothetical protein KFU94_36290 [Chloroflexi bacterium TSY]|nr:hypothetical protein [Chloroflexi bacterium TSY]
MVENNIHQSAADKETMMMKRQEFKSKQYVFVLWGDKFEEDTAALFTASLRRAGLRVKVVGLTGPRALGNHGLGLCSDLTLDQALPLAKRAICVIVPCSPFSLKRMENDPRIQDFFGFAIANQAKLVLGYSGTADIEKVSPELSSAQDLVLCPGYEELNEFVCQVANSLLSERVC